MRLSMNDPSVLPGEAVERRLVYAKYSDDPEILKVLSQDSFWFVRDYVAANVKTPEECLMALLADPDFRVRAEAERTLTKLVGRDSVSAVKAVGGPTGAKPSLVSQIEGAAERTPAPVSFSSGEKVSYR